MSSKIIKNNPFSIGKLVVFKDGNGRQRVVLITGGPNDTHFSGVVLHTFPEDSTHVGYASAAFVRSSFLPFTDVIQISNG